jgi:hypothetical protein
MATQTKGKSLKNQFWKASSLIAISILLLSSTKCSYDPSGTTVMFAYPKENIANIRTITNSCPIKVSEPITQPLTDLDVLVCLSPAEAAEFRRQFELKCK